MYVNIRTPTRSEPLGHEPDALALLEELREATQFKLIPAFRDARSSRFQETLIEALEAKLRERAVHQAQGGAPGEYRQVSRALSTIKEVADALVEPLWAEMQDGVLGLARDGRLNLDAEAGDLVAWMASKIKFHLVTGEHDARSVAPVEVGSGLQSLLDLAVLRGGGRPKVLVQSWLSKSLKRSFIRRHSGRLGECYWKVNRLSESFRHTAACWSRRRSTAMSCSCVTTRSTRRDQPKTNVETRSTRRSWSGLARKRCSPGLCSWWKAKAIAHSLRRFADELHGATPRVALTRWRSSPSARTRHSRHGFGC